MARPPQPLLGLRPFQGPEHQPFTWEGGRPAALLLHGFPSTPAEMRPLAEALHSAGWTVSAPLLPGFGQDIATLPQRDYREWTACAVQGLRSLKRDHSPVALVGYSMGGAVSLLASLEEPPAGLVLLAPFWSTGGPLRQLAWPFLRLVYRRFRPFRGVDFSDPRIRLGIAQAVPEVDLDDPRLQEALRDLAVPFRVFDQVRSLGREALARARLCRLPALVVQGVADTLVRPADTRRLALRLPGPLCYLEVPAAHDLLDPDRPAWPEVCGVVLDFLGRLR